MFNFLDKIAIIFFLLFFTLIIASFFLIYYVNKSKPTGWKNIINPNVGRQYYITERRVKKILTPKKFEKWKKKNKPKGIGPKYVYVMSDRSPDEIIYMKAFIKRIKIKLKRWMGAYP